MKPPIERCFDASHPALAGHFPGDPIVPGVALLDEVMQALAADGGPWRLTGVPVVKFMLPLKPAQPFAIELERVAAGTVKFECRFPDGRVLARGRLTVEAD